jgi:sterol desaturase/sphingolipid hydroxylase (fatty acid hydroxylase superfamily)
VSELLSLKTILVIALVFVPLERIASLHPKQKILQAHWANDLIYLFLNSILIQLGLLLLTGAAMNGIRLAVPDVVGVSVRSQPIWRQATEVVVIADCGFYEAHRAFHEVPFLWRFHAIHHCIEEINWLAAHRVHPLDQILTKAASVVPVFTLGFSDATIPIFALSYQCQSLLIHSNTRIGFGPLRWVLASPPFPHWHHANEPEAIDKNFAA